MSKPVNYQTPTKIKALQQNIDWKELAEANKIKTKAKKNNEIVRK